MIAKKLNFEEEAVEILRSLNYSDVEIYCIIKDKETLKKVMLIEGYREGYNCLVMVGDVDSETDPVA